MNQNTFDRDRCPGLGKRGIQMVWNCIFSLGQSGGDLQPSVELRREVWLGGGAR